MKTFASTALVAVALACSACGGGASADKQPEAPAAAEAQTAAANPTTDLPEQFKESWKVGVCPGLHNQGTGLEAGDIITIKDPVGLEIRLGIQGNRTPDPKQRWLTFIHNHALVIAACDFFVVVTATFRTLYVFAIMELSTRRILHHNVTTHPTAEWTLQQFARRSRAIMRIDSSFTTGTAFSSRNLTKR